MAPGHMSSPAGQAVGGTPRQRAVVLLGQPDPWLSALRDTLSGGQAGISADWDCRVVDAESTDPQWFALAGALDALQAPNLLLAVKLPAQADEPQLRALQVLLASRYRDVQAAAWVRAPRQAMEAALQEMLVDGQRSPPAELEQLYPRYRAFFSTIDDVFGRGQVLLAKLVEQALPAGDILQGLGAWLGLGIPGDRRVRPRPLWLAPAPLACLYAHRSRHPRAGGDARQVANRRLARVLSRMGGPRLRLSPAALRPLFVREREDITWMELRLGIPLSEDMSMTAGDVASLSQLAAGITREGVAQLQRLAGTGEVVGAGAGEDLAETAAGLVERLQRQLALPPEGEGGQEAALGRLVERAVQRAGGDLEGLPPAQAVAFLGAALAALRRDVRAMTDTPVELSAFGRFRRLPAAAGAGGRRPVQFLPLPARAP